MSRLTPREQEVVKLLAQGKRQVVIAHDLVISRRTVYNHVRSACAKTGATSTFDLALQIALEDSHKSG